ncbi:MAG TPA: UPF0179 family protein [Euryarchaeota archaeon]|nr:UPF0179 family protein [Thermoplasmatales archaeon]PMP73505.1 MAG: hypothetical protein C0180_06615 [Aciduliprofundum sp.]HEU13150.1 UPF0179 family protein [Euryarchaeota archaeon]
MIALVGKRMAKKDFVFQYLGGIQECRDCPLRNICFMLSPGKYYRITNVRDKEHQCKIHDLNKVVTVEVEELPVPITVEKKMAIEGSTININNRPCSNIYCKYYELCNHLWLKENMKVKIESVDEQIQCPDGRDLVKVYVRW